MSSIQAALYDPAKRISPYMIAVTSKANASSDNLLSKQYRLEKGNFEATLERLSHEKDDRNTREIRTAEKKLAEVHRKIENIVDRNKANLRTGISLDTEQHIGPAYSLELSFNFQSAANRILLS